MVLRCMATPALAALAMLLLCIHLEQLPFGALAFQDSPGPPLRQLRVVLSLDQGEVVVIKDALVNNGTYLWVAYSNVGDEPVNLTLLSYPSSSATACFAKEGFSLATLKKASMSDIANDCDAEPTEQGDMPNNATVHSAEPVVLALVNRNAVPVDVTDLQLYAEPSPPALPSPHPSQPVQQSRGAEKGPPMVAVYVSSIICALLFLGMLALLYCWCARRGTGCFGRQKCEGEEGQRRDKQSKRRRPRGNTELRPWMMTPSAYDPPRRAVCIGGPLVGGSSVSREVLGETRNFGSVFLKVPCFCPRGGGRPAS